MVPRATAAGTARSTLAVLACSVSRGRWQALLALAIAAPLSGCYHYAPVDSAAMTRGDPVRLQVLAPTVEVGDLMVRDVETVQGDLISLTEDRVRLSASWLTTQTGRKFDGLGYTIDLQRDYVEAILEPRLHTRNTILAVGVTAAGAILLHAALTGSLGSSRSPGGTGGPAK